MQVQILEKQLKNKRKLLNKNDEISNRTESTTTDIIENTTNTKKMKIKQIQRKRNHS